jgi:hypothetical protein
MESTSIRAEQVFAAAVAAAHARLRKKWSHGRRDERIGKHDYRGERLGGAGKGRSRLTLVVATT